jgi:phage gp46-like protein
MPGFVFEFAGPLGGDTSGVVPWSLARGISGDVALRWIEVTGAADLSKVLDAAGYVVDLETDHGLVTALLLSLFLDRRAEDDDVPPSGNPDDRRGWWGDQFLEVKGDRYGSRLWLLSRAKLTNETALLAEEYSREALAWMIEDKVVASIDFESEQKPSALWFAVRLNRPGRDAVTFRFARVWDHLEVT